MITNRSTKIVDFILAAILFVIVVVCLVPMLHVLATSLSANHAILSRRVGIWPIGWNPQSYEAVFSDRSMINSLGFTAMVTLVFTACSMIMTTMAAYPLSKSHLKGRSFFLIIILITMFFQGGMIPDYLLVRNLGLLNSVGALVLPQIISAYNMIILKTFFQNLPDSLEESARIDGASYLTILWKIAVPLSKPVLATLSLFYAVWRWNGFQDALLYITQPDKFPIQLKLYQIVFARMAVDISQNEGLMGSNLLPESLKAASVMFATVPILLVYPWLQRYFISGIMIGAVKG